MSEQKEEARSAASRSPSIRADGGDDSDEGSADLDDAQDQRPDNQRDRQHQHQQPQQQHESEPPAALPLPGVRCEHEGCARRALYGDVTDEVRFCYVHKVSALNITAHLDEQQGRVERSPSEGLHCGCADSVILCLCAACSVLRRPACETSSTRPVCDLAALDRGALHARTSLRASALLTRRAT